MIKTAIIGYGFSAQTFHIPFITESEDFKLDAISTSRAISPEALTNTAVYSDPQKLIEESDTELVVITAPNDAHFDLAKNALKHGKHVILEKPMVTSSQQAQELLTLSQAAKLTLSVYHNRRWDGDFLTLKKLIASGTLGKIHSFESHFDRFRPTVRERWREQTGEGAGIWFDLGSHLLDQAICLFGLPEAITAQCLGLRDRATVSDYFHVLLHYPEHQVILHSSPFAAGPNQRFHLQGSQGSYIKYGLDPQEDQLKGGLSPTAASFGLESAAHFGTHYNASGSQAVTTEQGCYQHYYNAIAQAILKGTEVPVSPEEGAQVVRLLELGELSSRLQKRIDL